MNLDLLRQCLRDALHSDRDFATACRTLDKLPRSASPGEIEAALFSALPHCPGFVDAALGAYRRATMPTVEGPYVRHLESQWAAEDEVSAARRPRFGVDIASLRDALDRAAADGADSVAIYRDERGEIAVDWEASCADADADADADEQDRGYDDDPGRPPGGWAEPDPALAAEFARRYRR